MLNRSIILLISLVFFLNGCEDAKQKITNIEENKQDVVNPDKSIKETSDMKEKSSDNEKSTNNLTNDAVKSNSQPIAEEKVNKPLLVNDVSSLSTKAIPWSWLYSSRDNADLLSKYKGYGFGDTSKKIIYLTFDEGYENGYTETILNVLKTNNVQATFFVTKPYVTGTFNGRPNSELLIRMSNEGHLIGNHSAQHKNMNLFVQEDEFNNELISVENALNSIPGCKMSKYFRPPEGVFSELSLYYTQKLGYKSIFFALAYKDYNIDNQPEPEYSKETLLNNSRDGMICLLHAVSKTNAEILDSLIKEWKNRGYEFKSLDELPS